MKIEDLNESEGQLIDLFDSGEITNCLSAMGRLGDKLLSIGYSKRIASNIVLQLALAESAAVSGETEKMEVDLCRLCQSLTSKEGLSTKFIVKFTEAYSASLALLLFMNKLGIHGGRNV